MFICGFPIVFPMQFSQVGVVPIVVIMCCVYVRFPMCFLVCVSYVFVICVFHMCLFLCDAICVFPMMFSSVGVTVLCSYVFA